MKSRGFTLIEFMIVIAIIGILALIAIPNFMNFQCKARMSEAGFNIDNKKLVEGLYPVCESDAYDKDSKGIFKKLYSGELKLNDVLSKDNISITIQNEIIKEEPLKNKTGSIRCYLQSGDLYLSDNWVGEINQKDNIFIFKSKYKNKEVRVSGPCVVQEE